MAIQPPNSPPKLSRGNYTTPPQTPQTPQTPQSTHQSTNQQATTDPYDHLFNQFPVNAPNSPSQTPNTPEANNQQTPSIEIQEVIRRWDVEYTKPNGASFHDIETARGFNIVITSKSNSRALTTPAAPINRELFPESRKLTIITKTNSPSEQPLARQLFPESPVADSDSDEGNTSVDFQSHEDDTLSTISDADSLTSALQDLNLSITTDEGEETDNEDDTPDAINDLNSLRKNLFGDEDEEGSASF